MPSLKHTHKYYKTDATGLWACALRDCTHYLPSNVADSIINKSSLCWECGERMDMDEIVIKINKPICHVCLDKSQSNTLFDSGIGEFLASKEK